MDKWSYMVVKALQPMPVAQMNEIGAEGWELVQVLYIPLVSPSRLAGSQSGVGDHTEYLFKRAGNG